MSIVEVSKGKIEQDSQAVDSATETKINALWEPGSPIEIVEFYELIADEARHLIRRGIPIAKGLQAADAIHLATAYKMKVSEFYTYDQKLTKFAEAIATPFVVMEPKAKQATIPLTTQSLLGP